MDSHNSLQLQSTIQNLPDFNTSIVKFGQFIEEGACLTEVVEAMVEELDSTEVQNLLQ
jgi:hypothetical protein